MLLECFFATKTLMRELLRKILLECFFATKTLMRELVLRTIGDGAGLVNHGTWVTKKGATKPAPQDT